MGINQTKGKEYQDFVEYVYKTLIYAEASDSTVKPISIERNKIIISNSGTPSEIDLYWEFSSLGVTYRVAIECKNYNRPVDISKVRDFADKIAGQSGLKGLMVSSSGFSQDAIKRATFNHIDTIVIRQQTDADWEGYLTGVDVRIHLLPPFQITRVQTYVDKDWAVSVGFTEDNFGADSNQLMLEDNSDGFQMSFHDIFCTPDFADKPLGKHTWRKTFTDGWFYNLQDPLNKVKIDAIEIDYIQPDVITDSFSIDMKKNVLAIIEYMQGQKDKFALMHSGMKKHI